MVLSKLKEAMKGVKPEDISAKSKGSFSNMTVRRAMAGRGIDLLKAKAIAKSLHKKLEELI